VTVGAEYPSRICQVEVEDNLNCIGVKITLNQSYLFNLQKGVKPSRFLSNKEEENKQA